ncbi:MAG: hypothetical protein Q9187_009665, partial [Circinaria calcarea]
RYLLSFLPQEDLLALRLVSRTCRDAVEPLLDKAFETVWHAYPEQQLPVKREGGEKKGAGGRRWSEVGKAPTDKGKGKGKEDEKRGKDPNALQRISEHVRILHLSLSPYPNPPHPSPPPSVSISVSVLALTSLFNRLPNLTHLHLHLSPPSSSSPSAALTSLIAPPLLISTRHALESASLPRLRSLALENLTIGGVLAFRWGPFTSLPLPPSAGGGGGVTAAAVQTSGREREEGGAAADRAWTTPFFWTGITALEIGLFPWWTTPYTSSPSAARSTSTSSYRTGIKCLHDFLSSFAPTLTSLSFSWLPLPDPPLPP